MRLGTAILALAAALALGGCSLRKTPTAKAAPPPPKPAAPAKPAEPLSVPQTNVELPAPQPIPPDALPPVETGEPAAAPPASRPTSRPTRTPSRAEQPAPPAATPAPAPQQATEPPPRQPYVEKLSPEESKRLHDEALGHIQETEAILSHISQRRKNQQSATLTRVEFFLKQAKEADSRGDMTQASELAGRALVLAKELRP